MLAPMKPTNPNNLGECLRTLRGTMNLREAAKQTDLDFTYLSKIENNKEVPSWDAIKRLLKLYGEKDVRSYAYWQLAKSHGEQLKLAIEFAAMH